MYCSRIFLSMGKSIRGLDLKTVPGVAVRESGVMDMWKTLFDGYNKALPLKRYRCPCCGCVIRLRPSSHLSRFQAPTQKIKSTLSIRVRTGRWPPGASRQRSGHWLRSLKRKSFYLFGFRSGEGLMKAFDYLLLSGVNPVSRSAN